MKTTAPAELATVDLALYRLADVRAADEALTALRAAVIGAKGNGGALGQVLAGFAAGVPPAEALASPAFTGLVPGLIVELREIAATRPATGACTVATGLQIWLWTMDHFRDTPHAAIAAAELAQVLGPLLAARSRILELAHTDDPDRDARALADDLSHVHAARAAAAVGTACAELVFGYRRHLSWDGEGCASCYNAAEIDELDGLIPGLASTARVYSDVVERDGSHAAKAGPCAKFDGVETFTRLRARLDGCLTGARRSKDRAAARLACRETP